MVSKVIKRISSSKSEDKKTSTKSNKLKSSEKNPIKRTKKEEKNIEKILIENFIEMQKVMTHMAEKFDKLTNQIENLLILFEDSAKALTQKEINLELKRGENPKETLDKLNRILNQNKLIAKGLTLMHETANNPHIDYSIGNNTPVIQQTQQPQLIRNQTKEIEKEPIQRQQMAASPQTQRQQTFPTPVQEKKPIGREDNAIPPFKSF